MTMSEEKRLIISRVVSRRILFYLLLILYVVGLAVGGKGCYYAAVLAGGVPMLIPIIVGSEFAYRKDYITAIASYAIILFLLASKILPGH